MFGWLRVERGKDRSYLPCFPSLASRAAEKFVNKVQVGYYAKIFRLSTQEAEYLPFSFFLVLLFVGAMNICRSSILGLKGFFVQYSREASPALSPFALRQ